MRVIEGGDAVYTMAIATENSRTDNREVRAQSQAFMASLPQHVAQAHSKITQSMSLIRNTDMIRKAAAVVRKARNVLNPDAVRRLKTIGDYQNAPNAMRPYLLANPTVNKLWQRGQVEGWGSEAPEEHVPLARDHHYRGMTSGRVIVSEEGYKTTQYASSQHREVYALTVLDKFDIRASSDAIEKFIIDGGDDPTSEWNSTLSL